jgi:23S rRNA (uracil1939-C5)-methyltransferase
VLGFRARRSHVLVALAGAGALAPAAPTSPSIVPAACPLFGPELARALPALRALARGLAPDVELEVQAGAEGVHVHVSHADLPSAAHALREVDRLAKAGIVGLTIAGLPTMSWGLPEVDVAEPGSPRLALPGGGFAQVGRAANAALIAAVLEAVGPAPGVVQELYAGSGNFTRHLVGVAKAVYASDGDPAAVARGERNVPRASWDRRPHAVTPDTVVLDPPRDGADRPHLTAASRARRRVVYVSCDPQTLGRDARALVAAGFRLAGAVALDLMPQTFHVEVVATFDRA